MGGYFSPNSPFGRAFAAAGDLVIVNLLTIAGCLPLFSAGASLVAGARLCGEMVREEEGYVVRTWWRAFRAELVPSLAWWLPVLVGAALGGFEYVQLGRATAAFAPAAAALGAALLLAALLVSTLLVWLVALQAFFSAPLGARLRTALALALGYLPRTCGCLLAPAALGAALLYPPTFGAAAWFFIIIGPGFCLYLAALLQRPALDRLRSAQ